jgi:hypothetical protein
VRLKEVIGHGTVGVTACPGNALGSMVPQIRRAIRARIKDSGGTTEPPTTPPPDDGGGVEPK